MSESNEERISELDRERASAGEHDTVHDNALKAAAQESDDRAFQAAVADQKSDAKPFMGSERSTHEEPILRYFKYEHLPINLQMISAPFSMLALNTIMKLPRNAERSTALRKLLEAKDAAVRAALPE